MLNRRLEDLLWPLVSGVASEVDVTDGPEGSKSVAVRVGSTSHSFQALWAGEGWPADVEMALRHPVHQDLKSGNVVVMARSLSPGSLEALRKARLGWADETGASSISLSTGLAVRTEGRQVARSPAGFAWTAGSIRVAEALLMAVPAGITPLAAAADVSAGRVSTVLQAFDAAGFTSRGHSDHIGAPARTLANRRALLDAWAEPAGIKRKVLGMFAGPTVDPSAYLTSALGPILDRHGVAWATTGPMAADLVAPYLSEVPTVHLYVTRDSERALARAVEEAHLVPVTAGGRFEIAVASPPTMANLLTRDGISIVHPVRIHADLMGMGGRYAEAGIHLLGATDDATRW